MNRYEVFEKLPDEKKDKIRKACLEVFAEQGYEGASTNDIVKKAGISKGILFHYFGSKMNLYLYILDITLDRVLEKFRAEYANASSDLFERIALSGRIKWKLSMEEPMVYKLIFVTFINTPKPIENEIRKRYQKLYEIGVPLLREGLDLSGLRDGADPEKAVEVVLYCMEGLQTKYRNDWKNIRPEDALNLSEQLAEESKAYIDLLKKGIYE